jgi:hypothetical protein
MEAMSLIGYEWDDSGGSLLVVTRERITPLFCDGPTEERAG